jgi:hypothetical protein
MDDASSTPQASPRSSGPRFGSLARVELREAWQREDSDFSPWLAESRNLALLSETLGMELEVQAREERVGSFWADLVCRDAQDGTVVLIENQLERTDHTHLGQIITYAAGLDAVTVIWIAARFTEEHRAALDWLNEISHEKFRFFGLEIELWRIGDSPVAPKFNVVARPNDWSKSVRERSASTPTEGESLRVAFWSAFLTHLHDVSSPLAASRTPPRNYWLSFPIGRSFFQLEALAGFRDGYVMVHLKIHGPRGHEAYRQLEAHRASIDAESAGDLDWDFDPDRKQSYIRIRRDGVDPTDESQWPDLFGWLEERLRRLDGLFRSRIAAISES